MRACHRLLEPEQANDNVDQDSAFSTASHHKHLIYV